MLTSVTIRDRQLRKITACNIVKRSEDCIVTKIKINGVDYIAATNVMEELGISRQTLWRWRQQGNIPGGHKLRNRRLVFTAGEVKAIREYAYRVEPATDSNVDQMKLFSNRGKEVLLSGERKDTDV